MVFYESVLPVRSVFLSEEALELFLHAALQPHNDVWIVAFVKPPFYPRFSYLSFEAFVFIRIGFIFQRPRLLPPSWLDMVMGRPNAWWSMNAGGTISIAVLRAINSVDM